MTGQPFPRLEEHGAVLAGVKAKPCGWPAASLDTACGRLVLAAIGNEVGPGQDASVMGSGDPDRGCRAANACPVDRPDDLPRYVLRESQAAACLASVSRGGGQAVCSS
jgi:hypothetical protein